MITLPGRLEDLKKRVGNMSEDQKMIYDFMKTAHIISLNKVNDMVQHFHIDQEEAIEAVVISAEAQFEAAAEAMKAQMGDKTIQDNNLF